MTNNSKGQLVCQHVEKISQKVLEDYLRINARLALVEIRTLAGRMGAIG
jgi:hypothetical protein